MKSPAGKTNINLYTCSLIGAFFVLMPAIWNGFPFIFSDSGAYIISSIQLIAPPDRPMFYGLIIRLADFFSPLWGAIYFQSVILIFLLLEIANILYPTASNKILLFWIFIISVCTSVSWFAGQLSPDIYTSILFLSLLILGLEFNVLHVWRKLALIFLTVLSICVHSSNLLIGFGTALSIVMIYFLQKKSLKTIFKFTLTIITSFFLAIFLIIFSNIWSHYGVTLNPSGKVFMLARILQDGPGLKFLQSTCKKSDFKLCMSLPILEKAREIELQGDPKVDHELKNLVASSFLWGEGLKTAGGVFSVNAEAGFIIKGALRAYPIEELTAFFRNSLDQFTTFSVGEQLHTTLQMEVINNLIKDRYPADYYSYIHSQQSENKLGQITQFLNAIYLLFVLAGALLCATAYLSKKNDSDLSEKIVFITISLFSFLLFNAMVTGGLSGVFPRYQGRVIWIVPSLGLLFLIGYFFIKYPKKLMSSKHSH